MKAGASAIDATLVAELFPGQISKAELRKISLMEAAIDTYSAVGIDYVSFEDIARAAKTSRALIQHHFPTRKDLFKTAAKWVRLQHQKLAVEAIRKAGDSPREVLRAYVSTSLGWVRHSRVHSRFWLFYFNACALDPELRAEHRRMTEMGCERIAQLIGRYDVAARRRGRTAAKRRALAKTVQSLISGAYLQMLTEALESELDPIVRATTESCLALLDA